MSKLDVGVEHGGTGANAPGDDRLGDLLVLDQLPHLVLLGAAHLAQHDDDLHLRVLLVAPDVVDERRPGVPATHPPITVTTTARF